MLLIVRPDDSRRDRPELDEPHEVYACRRGVDLTLFVVSRPNDRNAPTSEQAAAIPIELTVRSDFLPLSSSCSRRSTTWAAPCRC